MSNNESLLNQLERLQSWKKSKKFYAEKLGITEDDIEVLLKELRSRDNIVPEIYPEQSIKTDMERGTMESNIELDFEPKTVEELINLHKIDITKFTISNYWSKIKPNGKFTSSVFCKRKQPSDYTPEDFSKFLENYKPNNIIVPKKETDISKKHIDVELSISDYHLAKKYVNSQDNDIIERGKTYIQIARDLILKASSAYNLNTIVLVLSNDFFHTDNYHNTTTNFTPQDVIAEYSTEYEVGFNTLVDTINICRNSANDVTVLLVQGNHDRTKSFYLAHALEVYFKNDFDVSFIRHHSTTKGIKLGNTFIGYHHGNKCKLEELPLLFATDPEYSSQFGNAIYREVHTGDKHHYMAKEVKGVRIQQMPSLSGTDRWHLDNNYVNNIRAALLIGYDAIEGKVVEFEKRI